MRARIYANSQSVRKRSMYISRISGISPYSYRDDPDVRLDTGYLTLGMFACFFLSVNNFSVC
uniref:Uncharacterized protein n=1 Tax=Nelumbo nucifera TaxID=4432 RepID=A0A822Y2Z1_NELNU|nr:TPA_asm: hypothetical protein HUJ06_029752 [Nelumbo nucifera]